MKFFSFLFKKKEPRTKPCRHVYDIGKTQYFRDLNYSLAEKKFMGKTFEVSGTIIAIRVETKRCLKCNDEYIDEVLYKLEGMCHYKFLCDIDEIILDSSYWQVRPKFNNDGDIYLNTTPLED